MAEVSVPLTKYWLNTGETPAGPFTLDQVHAELAAGRATWQTSACLFGGTVWLPLLKTPGIGPGLMQMEAPESRAKQAKTVSNRPQGDPEVPHVAVGSTGAVGVGGTREDDSKWNERGKYSAQLLCPRCGSHRLVRLAKNDVSPFPGYRCGGCGRRLRERGSLIVYLTVLAIGLVFVFGAVTNMNRTEKGSDLVKAIGLGVASLVCVGYAAVESMRPAPRKR